jgi:hypothetical protein
MSSLLNDASAFYSICCTRLSKSNAIWYPIRSRCDADAISLISLQCALMSTKNRRPFEIHQRFFIRQLLKMEARANPQLLQFLSHYVRPAMRKMEELQCYIKQVHWFFFVSSPNTTLKLNLISTSAQEILRESWR